MFHKDLWDSGNLVLSDQCKALSATDQCDIWWDVCCLDYIISKVVNLTLEETINIYVVHSMEIQAIYDSLF